MPYENPLPVDSVGFATDPAIGSIDDSATFPPVSYGGALYLCLAPKNSGHFNIWKSTDSGATWNTVDAANAPVNNAGECAFDGTDKIAVIHYDIVAGIESFLQIFDLATETWGAPLGGGPIQLGGQSVSTIGFRSSRTGVDDVVFVYPNPGAGHIYLYGSVSAGMWNYPIGNLDQNFAGGLGVASSSQPVGFMDAFDTFHVVFGGTEGVNSYGYYQAIDNIDGLGPFKRFNNADTAAFPEKRNIIGRPVVVGVSDTIFIPFTFAGNPADFSTYFAGGYVGTPLAAPVWTQVPAIDPGFATDSTLNPNAAPVATSDGTTVFVVYVCQSQSTAFGTGRVQLCQSTDLATWTAETAYNLEDDLGFLNTTGDQNITNPIYSAGIAITATNFLDTEVLRFFLAVAAAPVAFVGSILNAAAFFPVALPRLVQMDATGAAKSCFPMKKRTC